MAGFDFNAWQQQMQANASSTSNLGGVFGCLGINFVDMQGLFKPLPNWMDGKIGGLASLAKGSGKESWRDKMFAELSQINKDGLAQLSQAGQGLIGPASDFSGAPTSGLAMTRGSDIELS